MIEILAVALVLAVASVLFVLQPILRGRGAPLADDDAEEISEAELRKRVALRAIRDAEYDRVAGKLNDADYRALRTELAAEALAAMRAAPGAPGAPGAGGPAPAVGEADELEQEIARYRRAMRAATLCPRCAYANEPGSRFCARCGTVLEPGQEIH